MTEQNQNLTKFLKTIIYRLKKNNIRVSLFIEPKVSDVKLSKRLGAKCIELHTGKFCDLLNNKKETKIAFLNLKKSASYAHEIGLEVHAGHGLTYQSASQITKIKYISEFNIGHFIVSESLFIGLKKTIKIFKRVINK